MLNFISYIFYKITTYLLFVLIMNIMPSYDIMQCTLTLVDCCVILCSLFGGAQDKFWSLLYLFWYISFYPTLSWHVPYVNQLDPVRTHSIIILLSHTYRIELYIVVVLFQKKDDHQQQNRPPSPQFFIKKVVKISLLSFHIVFNPSTPHRNRTSTPFDCCVMHSWWWYML